MANGRKLFREYAQSKGKEAKEFVAVISEQYNYDTLITKTNDGKEETTTINYKDLFHWLVSNKKVR